MDKALLIAIGVVLGFAITAANTFVGLECYRAVDGWYAESPR